MACQIITRLYAYATVMDTCVTKLYVETWSYRITISILSIKSFSERSLHYRHVGTLSIATRSASGEDVGTWPLKHNLDTMKAAREPSRPHTTGI